MSGPLRVCIAAENVSRRMGGEAILPYHYFRLFLARDVDVHLITHERCRTELLDLFPEQTARLHFVPDRPLQKLLFRLGTLLPGRLAEATFGLATQLLTQRGQRRVLRSLATSRCVVHQPTPVAPRFPSLLSGLGVPVIIGPLNGGMEFPAAFQSLESPASRVAISVGRALTDLTSALCAGKRQAAAVLVSNPRTRAALPHNLRGRIIELAENAVEIGQWAPESGVDTPALKDERRARFLFAGRLVDWKALDIVLEAMAFVGGVELDVVGDGPMREVWEAKSREPGLRGRVRFHGWQPQSACAALLHPATALVLPSLYECGGAVVLEAMAAAKPVIAAAWGGPADYLDASCGILIEPTSRPALVSGFAEAMQRLATSPQFCAQLGAAGRTKVLAKYDWERKADQMLEIYDSVL